jgi:hypothetical protein
MNTHHVWHFKKGEGDPRYYSRNSGVPDIRFMLVMAGNCGINTLFLVTLAIPNVAARQDLIQNDTYVNV